MLKDYDIALGSVQNRPKLVLVESAAGIVDSGVLVESVFESGGDRLAVVNDKDPNHDQNPKRPVSEMLGRR